MGEVLDSAFSPEERIQFLDDVWAMVRVGRVRIGDYLAIVKGMPAQRSPYVLASMTSRFEEIHDWVVRPEDRPAFEDWTQRFFGP
jgi:hypothetical protein